MTSRSAPNARTPATTPRRSFFSMRTFLERPLPSPAFNLKLLPIDKIHVDNNWRRVMSAFPVLYTNMREMPDKCDENQFHLIKNLIIENKMANIVTGYVINCLVNKVTTQITDTFWLNFTLDEMIDKKRLRAINVTLPTDIVHFAKFGNAIEEFYNLANLNAHTIDRLQMLHNIETTNVLKEFRFRISALLHSQLPCDYRTIVYQFYKVGLRVSMREKRLQPLQLCTYCKLDSYSCKCKNLMDLFEWTNWHLITLGLMESITIDVLMDLMSKVIDDKVDTITSKQYGEYFLDSMENWVDTMIRSWMSHVFEPKCNSDISIKNPLFKIFIDQLKNYIYKSFLKKRLSQLYDLVVQYPYSEPAIIETTIAFEKTVVNTEELRDVIKSVEGRFLQQNMHTNFILFVYVTAKKVLLTIDPSGELLREVRQALQ